MTVVPAGVHHVWAGGAVGQVVFLPQGKGIDITADANHAARAGLQTQYAANHARGGWSEDLNATKRSELLGDKVGGFCFLERKLGIGMQVTAPGNHLVFERFHFHREIGHEISLLVATA